MRAATAVKAKQTYSFQKRVVLMRFNDLMMFFAEHMMSVKFKKQT